MRMQNIRKDLNTPDDVQLKLEEAAPAISEINQYGDGGALIPKAAGGKLFDWLKAELKTDAPSTTVAERSDRVHFYPAVKRNSMP